MRAGFKYLLARIDSRLPAWARRMIRDRKWQKSSAISAIFWLVGTLVVFKLVARLGYGWEVNATVSLTFDLLLYAVNRLWVWSQGESSCSTSVRRNMAVWSVFFPLNILFAWLLMSQADVGTLPARSILGGYGLAMNPVMFKIRDQVVFNHLTLKTIAIATVRAIRKTTLAVLRAIWKAATA